MKRISLLILLWALLPLAVRAQDVVSVRMVSADSLVQVMRMVSGNSLFIARAGEDPATYSVEAPRAQFLDQALQKLRTAGYTVTEWGGSLYIVHGHSLHTATQEGLCRGTDPTFLSPLAILPAWNTDMMPRGTANIE